MDAVPSWEEFHRTVDPRIEEGRRAVEKIAAEAAYTGYELDIHPESRPLMDPRRESTKRRAGPKRAAGPGKTRRQAPGATGKTSTKITP